MIQFVYGIISIICSALLAYTLTPPVRVLAFKIGAVDVPIDNRRIHNKPIPRIGGLAIYLSFTLTTLLFCGATPQLFTIWVGGGILVILGILDDIYRLNAWLKFAVQLVVTGFAVGNGCIIDHINLGGAYINLGVLAIPVSVLWIAGLTNAINFIDGLDGLACGVSAISSLSLLFVVLLHGDVLSTIVCGILLGSCMGFLPFNSNPARIFMGDTGALFLGFTLAVLSVSGVFKLHAVLSFLFPLVIFALPIFDTAFAIFRRILAGKSPFAPDRGHLHHRLIDMGFTQKESVRILYAICGILGLVAVFCTESMFEQKRVTKAVCIAIIAIVVFIINFIIMKNPSLRRHSGLTEDDMTTADYISELDPEKAKKIEVHNGATEEDIKRLEEEIIENTKKSAENGEAVEKADNNGGSKPNEAENKQIQ